MINKQREELHGKKRESFKSSFGLFAAAVGSAVGLGNIWRFPYIAGMNGGAAFILIYLICVAIIGLPVLLSEFIVGRKGKSNQTYTHLKIWLLEKGGIYLAY